jgi:DNA-binding FadR family transcriptional regulator
VKFVASGDPDAAEHAMVKHLERSAALFVHQTAGAG